MVAVVRYHPSMADFVIEFCLAGLSDNADLARVLEEGYGYPVTSEHVSLWRRQHPRFERACVSSLVQLQAVAMGKISQAIHDGDLTRATWLMERTHPAFKPSSKLEHQGRIEGLGDMLARRVSEEQLREQGVLTDDDE